MPKFVQRCLFAICCFLLWPIGANAETSAHKNGCPGVHHEYALGPKTQIDRLYPVISTASQSSYDKDMAVAASVQLYLQNSLIRDGITDACGLQVVPILAKGYVVSFSSSMPLAAEYGARHIAWLKNGALALQGVQACQNSKENACWEPKGAGLSCKGPWQFYLPLGLPLMAQKMVMLLHYPPYSAMQQSDYLNNATLHRWQRLLLSVGVSASDWTLYTSTVDIFPIAAPGSGQGGCFTTANASQYFGAAGSGYIPAMLNFLSVPSTSYTRNRTLPVIAFGSEAIGYWNSAYPQSPTGVLKAGTAQLSPGEPSRLTPYSGANHPIAAVYQTCQSQPGIVTMVGQDLATACFAKRMGDLPSADPVEVQSSCQAAYVTATPAPDPAEQICVNAVIDKSPQFAPWSAGQAKAWCLSHSNQACPLPDYSVKQ
ncbi:MAG: hypothetical protein RLZ68_2274 [Pseudomonadota bacterium]